MSLLRKIKRKIAENRFAEERLYELALREIQNGFIRDGLWAKALASSGGDEDKAKSLYIKYRVVSMLDEVSIVDADIDDRLKEMERNARNRKYKEVDVEPVQECFKYETLTESWEAFENNGFDVNKVGEKMIVCRDGEILEFSSVNSFIRYCNEVCT